MKVYVPLRPALARPELVEAPNVWFSLDLVLDHALYHLELPGWQALVQKNASATRDQAYSRPQDQSPYKQCDQGIENGPSGCPGQYKPCRHPALSPHVRAQVIPFSLYRP